MRPFAVLTLNMDSFLKLLENNPKLNLVFLFLAIFSICFSAFLYFRSKREKLPVYNKKTFNLIRNQIATIKGLRVTFEGKAVNDLTLTQVALWNTGKQTINSEDVAPAEPLRIVISDNHEILQAEIKYARTKANNFLIELDRENQCVLINFDYLDTNDGVAISIYHTGSSDEDVTLLGTIKGVREIRLAKSERFRLMKWFLKPMFGHGDPPFGIGFFIILALPFWATLLIIDLVRLVIKRTPREFKLERM